MRCLPGAGPQPGRLASLLVGEMYMAAGSRLALVADPGPLADSIQDHVKKNLRVGGLSIRVRADTFGYLQRSWPDPSPIDSSEARAVGKFAVGLAKKGERSGSVAIVRKSSSPYRSELKRIELTDVAGKTRRMPPEFIEGHNNVSRAFIRYCRPLVGPLPEVVRI